MCYDTLSVSVGGVMMVLLSLVQHAIGIRFVIDKEECFSHNVNHGGDMVYVSFVVINTSSSSWHHIHDGVHLMVKGPTGEVINKVQDKSSQKFKFMAHHRGLHRFCFTNNSPLPETVDFDLHVEHFTYLDQHAKDEHIDPLLELVGKLEEALFKIQFEQHWMEAQTQRQALVNKVMSKRAIHKAVLESAALVGASFLQIYLLRRLFDTTPLSCL